MEARICDVLWISASVDAGLRRDRVREHPSIVMGALPKSEYVERKDMPYVEELREFFTMHGLRFGCSDDLQPFAEKLSLGGVFRDDMQSMIRSIIFREGGGIPRAELLRIVTVAVGGADVDDSSREAVVPVQTILKFLSQVMRTRWGMSETEANESREDVSDTLEASEAPWVISAAEKRPPLESASVEDEMQAYGHSSLYCESMVMYSEPDTPGGRVREFPMPLPRRVSPVAAKQDEVLMSPWIKQPWVQLTALCVAMLVVSAIVFLMRFSKAPGGGVSKATEPVITPYYPPGPVTAPAEPRHVAAGGAKVTVSGRTVKSGHQDGRVRVAGVSSAVVGGDASEAYSGTVATAAPTVTQAPMARGESTAQQPPAPIYRVTPMEGQLRPAKAVTATSMSPTGARNSRGYPVYTRQGFLIVAPMVMARNLISAPAPGYPKLAGLMHLEGKVVLRAVVDRSGNVIETEVLQGHHLLRGAARDAVQRWRYRPYRLNDRPMEVATVVTVDFERK